MASSVPKPKDQRRNRNPKLAGDWVQLPRHGRRWMITDEDLERAGVGLADEITDLRAERRKRLAADG